MMTQCKKLKAAVFTLNGAHLVTTESPENDFNANDFYKFFILLASPTGFEPVLSP